MIRDMVRKFVDAEIVPNLNYVDEVFLLGPEMVFVLDIDTVLTDDEELVLADSLRDIEAVRA